MKSIRLYLARRRLERLQQDKAQLEAQARQQPDGLDHAILNPPSAITEAVQMRHHRYPADAASVARSVAHAATTSPGPRWRRCHAQTLPQLPRNADRSGLAWLSRERRSNQALIDTPNEITRPPNTPDNRINTMSIENHHDAPLTAKIITAIGTADLLGVTDKTIAARVNTNLVRIRAHLTAMVLAGRLPKTNTAATSSTKSEFANPPCRNPFVPLKPRRMTTVPIREGGVIMPIFQGDALSMGDRQPGRVIP